jgi:hypothetical protein
MQNNPYEQGGIAGPNQRALVEALSGGTAPAPPIQSEMPAPAQAAPALDFGRMTGYDQGKWDANKQDAKYQIGRTLAQFDPRQGVTPEVLAGLNGLGYGTFSGQGDKLNLTGLTDKGRQNKLSGDYSGADFIQGFKSGNGKWGYADPFAEAQQAQSQPRPQAGGGLPSFAGSSISNMLQSDAQKNIQQALGALQQPGMLQQLIAALGGQ